jgi:ankyrin repeat protein
MSDYKNISSLRIKGIKMPAIGKLTHIAILLSLTVFASIMATSSHAKDADVAAWNRSLADLIADMPELQEKKHKKKNKKSTDKEDKKSKTEEDELEKERKERRKIRRLTKKLYKAVKKGDVEKVKEYVLQHADTNYAKKDGVTMLHIAAAQGDLTTVRILASHGADISATTIKDWTPLHHAARFGHLEICKYLIGKGASMYVVNSDGKNAYTLARQLKHDDIIKFMNLWRKYH